MSTRDDEPSGERDRYVDPAHAAAFASRLRDSRSVAVPDAGHLPHLENPGPVHGAVHGFLTDEES